MEKISDEKLLKEQIYESIKSGQVKMRPRWHFVLKTSLIISGAIIILFALLYLASFIIFILRQTGIWFVPIFGWRGWYALLIYSNWLLLALVLFFIVVLEILASRYYFTYRYPLLYSALAVIFLVICGGYLVAGTSFHGRLLQNAEDNSLPLVGSFYRDLSRQHYDDVHRGEIIKISPPASLIIKSRRGEIVGVSISSATSLPKGADFEVGDIIVVFGSEIKQIVNATGIIKITE